MLKTSESALQELTPISKNYSIKLSNYIKQKIHKSGGMISFATFMQSALYAKNLGYYNNKVCVKFGKNGDFITAPMLGELFAHCVANQCSEIFNNITEHNILELGSGDGQLAYQLIKLLTSKSISKYNNIHLDNYLILEPSKELRRRQKKLLLNSNLDPIYKNKLYWIEKLPENFKGIILANEVLDALPVHLFKIQNNQIFEISVTLKEHNFCFITTKAPTNILNKIIKLPIANSNYTQQPYTSEICLLIPDLIQSLSKSLKQGSILLFDYGFLEHEYYHPDRSSGTLMCHYRHQTHTDPFFLPGLQDITAHVDFSMVIQSATTNGLIVESFASLANFLIANNLEFFFTRQSNNTNPSYKVHQELGVLMSPAEMGEIFKVLHLKKK